MPYEADDLYKIVADVESYAEFVPMCESVTVYDKGETGQGLPRFKVDLEVAYEKLKLHETFTSDVTCNPERRAVRAISNRKPVKALDCQWHVKALDEKTCEVSFSIDVTMASLALNLLLKGVFNKVLEKVMEAFEKRAKALYG